MDSKLKHSIITMVLDECERNTNRGIDESSAQQTASNSFVSQTDSYKKHPKTQTFRYDDSDEDERSSTDLKVTNTLTAYINESNRTNSLIYGTTSALSLLKDAVKQVFSS
jgi:hypothetical protein